jgi:hypothetical protein
MKDIPMILDIKNFIYESRLQEIRDAMVDGLTTDTTTWFDNSSIDRVTNEPNLWAWVAYDAEHGTDDYTSARFNKLQAIMKELKGIASVHFALLGPQSTVQRHIDSTSRNRDPSKEYNVLTGCIVPSNDSAKLGFCVGDDIVPFVEGKAIFFQGGVNPHHAWNYTDEWCALMVLYALKETIKHD